MNEGKFYNLMAKKFNAKNCEKFINSAFLLVSDVCSRAICYKYIYKIQNI